ncbi:MAG: DUF4249 domain-containing protein [Bacteroidales bacterium]|nr:DUF4249 domain-containing protein [Bacteroidales bacterium]
MKKITYIILILIIITSACTESYNPELKSGYTRLVVEGSISNEIKAHQVTLTKTADYFSNTSAPRVTGATVSITDGENIFNLAEVSSGLYETDLIAGEVGKTYTLSIDIDGELYEASCYMNLCPPIDSINFGYYDLSAYDIIDSSITVLLNALEPETPDNYYLWNIYRNGVLETDTLNERRFSDDLFINGYYMENVEVGWIEKAEVGDTIDLETQSITKEYYDYLYQVLSITDWDMGPFGGPPANPNGNIIELTPNDNKNDDPLGFFLAYSNYIITDTIPKKSEWIELAWF